MTIKELTIPGWIRSQNAGRTSCWVKDVTKLGATIVLQSGQPPDEFWLYFSQYATTFRRCEVEWRKEDSVGVIFLGGIYRESPNLTPLHTSA